MVPIATAHRLNVFLSRSDCLTNTVESIFRQWLMLAAAAAAAAILVAVKDALAQLNTVLTQYGITTVAE